MVVDTNQNPLEETALHGKYRVAFATGVISNPDLLCEVPGCIIISMYPDRMYDYKYPDV